MAWLLDFLGPAECRRAAKEKRAPGVALLDRRMGMCAWPIANTADKSRRKTRACGRLTHEPAGDFCLPHFLIAVTRKPRRNFISDRSRL